MSSEEAEEDVWNVERWVSQLNSLLEQQSSEEEDAQYVETIRTIYRRILTHFPTNVRRMRRDDRGRDKIWTHQLLLLTCRRPSGTAGCN